jgi:hypothetical protein
MILRSELSSQNHNQHLAGGGSVDLTVLCLYLLCLIYFGSISTREGRRPHGLSVEELFRAIDRVSCEILVITLYQRFQSNIYIVD